jgi:hypothetical protein
MSGLLLAAVVTVSLSIVATGVLGQCPSQCSCSAAYGADCTSSSLTELPQSGLNRHLTKLNASFNNITMLGKMSLKHISELVHLNLSHNQITSIHSQAFLTLKDLSSLDLSSNYITSIQSGTFMYNRQLTSLSLADNRMITLPNTLYLQQLHFFNLSHCNLRSINPHTFNNMQELRELYLDNNEIVSLNSEVFRRLQQLQLLDLCYNDLQNLHANVFSRLENLKLLSLCHNNVSKISATLLDVVVKIGDVDLEGNPWICDCNFADVYYSCVEEEKCRLNLTCEFPDRFRERHWNVIEQLGCMPTASPTTVGTPSEAEASATTHQTTQQTTELMRLTKGLKNDSWYWVTVIVSPLCLVVTVALVVQAVKNCRSSRTRLANRSSSGVGSTAEVSSGSFSDSSGGFNDRSGGFNGRSGDFNGSSGGFNNMSGGFYNRYMGNEDDFQQLEMMPEVHLRPTSSSPPPTTHHPINDHQYSRQTPTTVTHKALHNAVRETSHSLHQGKKYIRNTNHDCTV